MIMLLQPKIWELVPAYLMNADFFETFIYRIKSNPRMHLQTLQGIYPPIGLYIRYQFYHFVLLFSILCISFL